MSTSFQLLLPRQILAAMLAQAQAEWPNECCGLLAGTREAGGTVGRVERCYPLVNELASPTEYQSEPRSMFDAVKDMSRRDLDVLAVYHSHPTSAPIPSQRDRERNYSPDVVNVIIGLHGPQPEVRAWWLSADAAREAAWDVV